MRSEKITPHFFNLDMSIVQRFFFWIFSEIKFTQKRCKALSFSYYCCYDL